jgi:hypothetical protein
LNRRLAITFKRGYLIPKADEEFDKDSEMGKKMLNAIELSKVAYTESVHPLMSRTEREKLHLIL